MTVYHKQADRFNFRPDFFMRLTTRADCCSTEFRKASQRGLKRFSWMPVHGHNRGKMFSLLSQHVWGWTSSLGVPLCGEMYAFSNECLWEGDSLSRLYTASLHSSSGFVSTKSAKAECFSVNQSGVPYVMMWWAESKCLSTTTCWHWSSDSLSENTADHHKHKTSCGR